MKIICVVCPAGAPEIEESEYAEHMTTIHGGSQMGAIKAQRNIPKQAPVDLPPGVSPADLPDPDFLATIAEMEKEAARPQKPVLPQTTKSQGIVENSPPRPVTEKKPITLTYKYTGQDEVGHDVATLETDVADKHFAIAYCLQCNKQIESREVANLRQKEQIQKVEYEPTEETSITCGSCQKKLKNRKAYNMHRWRAHKGDENHE